MSDMLVKLYELPLLPTQKIEALKNEGITFRQSIPPEKDIVIKWVKDTFGPGWANETEVAFHRQPVSCFIALKEQEILGFACYEATARNFFGPTGVKEDCRGKGLGMILLLLSLHALKNMGYAYAIIGGVGPVNFYQKAVGATVIPDSSPGIYEGLLKNRG